MYSPVLNCFQGIESRALMTTTRWSLNVLHINLGFGKFDLIHHHKQVRFLFFMHYDNGLIVTTFAVLDISM